jgi:hypothetical protein
MTAPLMTRKQIAELIGCAVKTVSRNEERWRLNTCRVKLGPRFIRYRQRDALMVLRLLGVLN